MATKLLDTSFWSHALIPSQRTEEATAALHDLIVDDDEILVTPPVMVEFHSLLRKLTLRGTMTSADATTALATWRHTNLGLNGSRAQPLKASNSRFAWANPIPSTPPGM